MNADEDVMAFMEAMYKGYGLYKDAAKKEE